MKKILLLLAAFAPLLTSCNNEEKYFTVTYVADNKVVYTEKVKENETAFMDYIYEPASHQYYSSSWVDENNNFFTNNTKVTSDITITAIISPTVKYYTTSTDVYTSVNGLNYVHSDGKVVISEKYLNKAPFLATYAINNNNYIKEIYLPASLWKIFGPNFSGCKNLETIYFAGTETQWDSIQKDFVTIPTTTRIVFNTSFSY